MYNSWAESKITESAPDPVCNQISESGSAPDKILLLRMELMLNTGSKCLEEAFILKVMPKLDHRLGVLLKEFRVRVAGVLMWLAYCSLLHHIHLLAWIPFPICALLRKNTDTGF